MKLHLNILLLAVIITSCGNNKQGDSFTDPSLKKVKKEVIGFSEKYLKDQLVEPERKVEKDGIITLFDKQESFKIDPSKIVFGDIDGNQLTDAVIPVFIFRGESLVWLQHLVLLNDKKSFKIVKSFNDVLKVLWIKDGKITAEVSTVSPDSPGFGCDQCKVVVQFIYRDGNVIKAD